MSAWDDLPLSVSDRALYAKAGMSDAVTPPGDSPAVVVVDMNQAFVDDRYPTACEATGRVAAKAIATLLDQARRSGVPVFYVTGVTTHSQAVRGRWKSEYGRVDHPLLSQPAANEIVAELSPQPSDVVVARSRPSAFWGTGLVDLLIFHRVDTVIVTGMTTSGCVRATVVDAFSYNFHVVVPEECVADRGELPHKANLFDIHMKYGSVLPLDEVLRYVRGLPPRGRGTTAAR
jgi:nicotinamidase-related amidase